MPETKLQNCLLNPAPFPEKYTQINKLINLCILITLVNYCQLCINYESNKHVLKIFKKIKKSKYSSHKLQLKAYNISIHPKFKVDFCTP